MLTAKGHRATGFTLIELLVVVAIIALLISILLPSLTCARSQGRSAKCGALMRQLGTAMAGYFSENNDWIPGVNTTGANFAIGYNTSTDPVGFLRTQAQVVQRYDWMSPCLRYSTALGNNRAERFQTLVNYYQCPSNVGESSAMYYSSSPPDLADFTTTQNNTTAWSPISYLMPAYFQFWGQGDATVFWANARGTPVGAMIPPSSFEVTVPKYRSKLNAVGVAAKKICAADGTRYLPVDLALDFDIGLVLQDNAPNTSPAFGSFTDGGAFWSGSTAYGVAVGSKNWDGISITRGSPALGQNLSLSYRHGCAAKASTPTNAQSNAGQMNAMFFDGHVSRLSDRQSRNPEYWYPKGAIVNNVPGELMTNVPAGFEIP